MFGLSAQNLWTGGLLVIWGALLFGGFAAGRLNADRTHRIPRWARIASSFVLVVLAWSGFFFSADAAHRASIVLIGAGMTLGFVGDLFMAQLLPVKNHVIGGIAAFGCGHIAYITAFVLVLSRLGPSENPQWAALAAWLIIGALGWYFVVFRGQKTTTLHYAALPYALLLAGTAGVATVLALQNAAFVPVVIGAALFLLSDLILAAQLFNALYFPLIGDVIWLTYGPGQMLIVTSIGIIQTLP